MPSSDPLRVLLVFNPASGLGDPRGRKRRIERFCAAAGWDWELYETGGNDDLAARVRDRAAVGIDRVLVSGGDGTIAAAAGGLADSDIPIGVLPAGTGNILARELGIPLDLGAALRLQTGPHAVKTIDAMLVNGEYHVLNVGVGISSNTIRSTIREQKHRFGMLAYFWNLLAQLAGLRLHRFTLLVDGRRMRVLASEVMVANTTLLGLQPFRVEDRILPDDGQLDVLVLRARTIWDLLVLLPDALAGRARTARRLHELRASQTVVIHTRRPVLAEADGEIIGATPLSIRLAPHAVRVIVPLGMKGRGGQMLASRG